MIRISLFHRGNPFTAFFLIFLYAFLCSGNGGCGGETGPFSDSSEFITLETFQSASIVIGQADFTGNRPNRGGSVDSNTLSSPAGGPSEGSLYLADPGNHRVLGYHRVPDSNNKSADFVIGQTDLISNASGTGSAAFRFPTHTWTFDSNLYMADGNNRILIWNVLPLSNQAADVVVGQSDFTSSSVGTTPSSLDHPSRVFVVANKLIVSDQNNSRILIWNSIPTVNGTAADIVLGQNGFTSNAPGVSEAQLNLPTGIWSNGTRLAVSDTGNHRVMIWNRFPIANGTPADVVIGQPDFETATPGQGNQGLSSPQGITSNGSQLFIADSNNHRILIYNRIPTENQPEADQVLGQGTFLNNAPNDDDQDGTEDLGPSDRTLSKPTGLAAIGNRLLVTENGNHRVLIFKGN